MSFKLTLLCLRALQPLILGTALISCLNGPPARAASKPEVPAPACRMSERVGPAALPHVTAAIKDRQGLSILLVGRCGTKTNPDADRYRELLKATIERQVDNLRVDFTELALSNMESGRDALARLKVTVDPSKPDLVLWQFGLSNVFARMPVDAFVASTIEAIHWLNLRGLDVILIDLPYVRSLRTNFPYQTTRTAIATIAKTANVARISNYDNIEEAEHGSLSASRRQTNAFALVQRACLCTAEIAAQAIVASFRGK